MFGWRWRWHQRNLLLGVKKKNEAVGLGWRGPPQRQPNTQKVSVFGNRDQSPRRRSVAGARGSISPASPSLAGTPHSLRMLLCDPAPLMACCAHRIRVEGRASSAELRRATAAAAPAESGTASGTASFHFNCAVVVSFRSRFSIRLLRVRA